MPPPAHGLATRLVAGPVLRAQSDRRLVRLVREGYETAFEEIVRRYGRPLHRYAGAIVGSSSEDVVQDSFAKALQALRRDETDVELRPWLYRIVRNTALNYLRDRPVAAVELAEAIAGGDDPAEALEQREELADLIERLRSLPDAQRAAIVMRELEGLSHDEIAAALGMSGDGARQAIYRARQALRDGAGVLVPLPLLKALLEMHGPAAAEAATGAAGVGFAAKAAATTVIVAGAVGAGVALQERRGDDRPAAEARAAVEQPAAPSTAPSTLSGSPSGSGSGPGGNSGPGGSDESDSRGPGHSGDRSGPSERHSSGSGHGGSGDEQGLDDDREDRSGPSEAPEDRSGSDSGDDATSSGSSGSGSSGSGSSGSGSGSSGSSSPDSSGSGSSGSEPDDPDD